MSIPTDVQKDLGICSWGPGRPLLWDRRLEGCRQRGWGVPETGAGRSLGLHANEVMLSLPTGPGSPRWHLSESVTGQ